MEEEIKEPTPAEATVPSAPAAENAPAEETEEAALPKSQPPKADPAEETPPDVPDYATQAAEDLKEIRRLDPAYAALTHLGELPHARRFAQLRDLGLSVKEALAASNPRLGRSDGREHLRPPMGRALHTAREGGPGMREMEEARTLFSDLDDRQIAALYRRVRGN